ncbi:PREDICTED: COMM domain-containing protein 2 [Ficedula albicollis]|nr:PREDICTED: COMM domain-containing protein 2 [Ficedula albicollis]
MLLVLSADHQAHLGCLPRAGGAGGEQAPGRGGTGPESGETGPGRGESGHRAEPRSFGGRTAVRGALCPAAKAPRAPALCVFFKGKLNIGVDIIQHGVEGLVYLLTESSKLMISEVDFQDSINVLGFSDELNKSLLQLYLDNRKEIRSILGELAPRLPSYHSLEWRLDVQLASRSLRQQIKPAVTMKLHLNQNEDQTAQVLQTDPATLLHLIQQLEQALGEMKMNHCRRIVRNMK